MRPYKTAHTEAKTERIINRSRFISQCFPVRSEDEALSRLNEVRKQYPDATHVCYAYRIGELSETTRFSDAGEPSGTAGMPILEVLKANELTYVLCTVTRYFGGIALRCDYSRYSAIESLIAKSNAAITESEFTDEIRLSISCAKGEADSIIKAIIERTDGRCKPEIAGECELVLPQ